MRPITHLARWRRCALAAALLGAATPAVQAQAEPILGQLMLFGGNFCPRGWTQAAGQTLAISQNEALFSLLGTTYGGDGQNTFGLPDLRGRVPIGTGTGPGLTPIDPGERSGTENTTLTINNMPMHTHPATYTPKPNASTAPATNATPAAGQVLAQTQNAGAYSSAAADTTLGGSAGTVAVAMAGGNQPFSIRNPYLGMTWCIAFEGIFPSRND
ncbi:MAG: phage tail protein [Comamonas sp.]